MLRELFTGKDNTTYDLGRVLWALSYVALVVFTGWSMYRGEHFSVAEYAGGCAALLAGGAGGIALKSSTEPDQK